MSGDKPEIIVDMVHDTMIYGRTIFEDGTVTPWCKPVAYAPSARMVPKFVDGVWTLAPNYKNGRVFTSEEMTRSLSMTVGQRDQFLRDTANHILEVLNRNG